MFLKWVSSEPLSAHLNVDMDSLVVISLLLCFLNCERVLIEVDITVSSLWIFSFMSLVKSSDHSSWMLVLIGMLMDFYRAFSLLDMFTEMNYAVN